MPPLPAMKSEVPGGRCRRVPRRQDGRSVRQRAFSTEARQDGTTVVRLRKLAEPPGPDRRPALRQRPGNAVHAVHDAVTGPEDHRVRQVRLSHAPEVPGDLPDRGALQRHAPAQPCVQRRCAAYGGALLRTEKR